MAKAKTPPKKPLRPVKARPVVAEIVDGDDEGMIQPAEPSEAPGRARKITRLDDDDLESDPEISKALSVPSSEKGLATRDPLQLYLQDVRKYPVLSREDEMILAKKYYETKDPAAAQALVRANLRFVVKVAAEYSRFGARMIDLIQEGNVGLMHAVKEFNPYKGARVITYAVWWIRGYIQEYLMRQYSMVRIGTTQNQRKLFYQLQKQKESLDALGKNPDYAMLSERLGVPEDEVATMAQRLSGRDVSLDRPVDENSGTRLTDLQENHSELPIDDQLAKAEQLSMLSEKIAELRPTLNSRELILLEERILADDPLTLQEIGEKYGITREAVRQAEVRLMKKIREKMDAASDD